MNTYIPEKVLFRDEQILTINKSFEDFKQFGKGDNLLITGRSGSGKTATLKSIVKTHNGFFNYISGSNYKTLGSILRGLFNISQRNVTNLIHLSITRLNEKPQCLIIDEVDKIKDLKEFIDTLNHIYRETGVPIIIATNNLQFIKTLPEDAKMTFFFKPIHFSPYTVQELSGILTNRLGLAEIQLPEDKVLLISAIAGKDGSARLLLDTAYKCIKDNNFNLDFIKECMRFYEDSELRTFILKNTNTKERVLIRTIMFKTENNLPIDSSILLKEMNISGSSLSNMLDNLEIHLGVITTELLNFGGGKGIGTRERMGRMRVIRMDKDAYNLLKDCKELGGEEA